MLFPNYYILVIGLLDYLSFASVDHLFGALYIKLTGLTSTETRKHQMKATFILYLCVV